MNYLQLHFRGRPKWLGLPLSDGEFQRARSAFVQSRDEPHFMEFETIYGQSVWLNAANLQMVRFLLEMELPRFSTSDIKASAQDQLSGDTDMDARAIHWDVRVWLSGREKPLTIFEVSADDWVEITTAVQDRVFFYITDEDGEELAVRVADIELVVGIEVDRYSDDQLDIAQNEVCEEEKPA